MNRPRTGHDGSVTRHHFAMLIGLAVALGLARASPGAPAGRRDVLPASMPSPAGLADVRIGYFGPADPHHPEGGDLWLAAVLAVEEANRCGGYEGRPFRLVPAWSTNRWGSGVARLARMTYDEQVWALLGSIDGAGTHLAEQVVAKARLTLVNPASSDRSVNLANVPWVFSCLPSGDAQAEVLARALRARARGQPFAIVSATEHDCRVAAAALKRSLFRLAMTPAHHLQFLPGKADGADLVDRIADARSPAVVILAGPTDSGRLVAALARRGARVSLFGWSSMARRAFVDTAGPAAEGAVFPLPVAPGALSGPFARAFVKRHGRRPDHAAVQCHDATRLLIEAIRRAGLDRARIRDAVAALTPWEGEAGVVDWDERWQNRRPVQLATIRGGRVTSLPSKATAPSRP